MTSWSELRTVALVGTERRALPSTPADSLLADLPDELSAEHAALHAAALLGVSRRAGKGVDQTVPPDLVELRSASPRTIEPLAPNEAIQLLELMLTGNTGPGTMSNSLLKQWYSHCADHDAVVPHRLLVSVLDSATVTSQLRDHVRPVLGQRGHWLAAQRDKWSWAATGTADSESALATDLDALLEMPADRRDASLTAVRDHDRTLGRELIAEACQRLDAATRARVLGCLTTNLDVEDEDLLEAALDDRSKAVRATAIGLLEQLPTSARAARLTRFLEPLVERSGRLRTSIRVHFPDAPTQEQLRDVSPTGTAVVEQQWFDALVVGTPLSWWEEHLQKTPSQIVNAKLRPEAELLAAWATAAQRQGNHAWANVLFKKTQTPQLSALVGADAATAAFLATKNSSSLNKQISSLMSVPGPWSVAFSQQVLEWARHTNEGKGAQGRVNQTQTILADRLDPSTQTELTRWLESERIEHDDVSKNQALQRALRNVIQQLSFRTAIDKAFS